MKRIKYLALILFIPTFLLTGCIGGGGEPFNIQEFMKNPFVMGIIIIITLWYAFTHYGRK